MKTTEDILKEFRERFPGLYTLGDEVKLLEQFIKEALDIVREETIREIVLWADKHYQTETIPTDDGEVEIKKIHYLDLILELKANKSPQGDVSPDISQKP